MPEVLQQMLNYVIAIYIRLSAEDRLTLWMTASASVSIAICNRRTS